MYLVAPISTRNQFSYLLNSLGLKGCAVEVGTHRGEFALSFMNRWEGEWLYCVDPWSVPDGYELQAKVLQLHLGGAPTRDEDYRAAQRALYPHCERVRYLQTLSSVAVNCFADESLDFVYLDGDHNPDKVDEDMSKWWGKVKPSGLLAGHDIMMPGEKDGGWARYIQPIISNYSERWQKDVHLVVEENGLPWSWYIIKE
jgi:hypothetical protein